MRLNVEIRGNYKVIHVVYNNFYLRICSVFWLFVYVESFTMMCKTFFFFPDLYLFYWYLMVWYDYMIICSYHTLPCKYSKVFYILKIYNRLWMFIWFVSCEYKFNLSFDEILTHLNSNFALLLIFNLYIIIFCWDTKYYMLFKKIEIWLKSQKKVYFLLFNIHIHIKSEKYIIFKNNWRARNIWMVHVR